MTPSYDKAIADWRRVAATADKAWLTYRTARERLALKRGSFAAEQKFIDASQAVGRAQDSLEHKASELRLACMRRASDRLAIDARARVPYVAPTRAAGAALGETLYADAMRCTT
jgi:hypothetical protein